MNGKVFLMMFLGTLGLALSSSPQMFGATGGCDCPSKHPQQKFCDDSLGEFRHIREENKWHFNESGLGETRHLTSDPHSGEGRTRQPKGWEIPPAKWDLAVLPFLRLPIHSFSI